MSVPTITLAGAGRVGILPQAKLVGVPLKPLELPATVKLGANLVGVPDECPRFAAHFRKSGSWRPPDSVDYTAKAGASLMTMLGNDQWGDCVIAGKAHSVGVWTANDSDSGGEVIAGTDECVSEYHRICGRGDNGCVIREVLDAMQLGGLTVGGRKHHIAGYVAIDPKNQEEVKAAVDLFGAVTLGINFPGAWANSSTWDVTNSAVVGGHDVPIVRYDPRGVYVSSWGRVYLMTWRALAQAGRVDEAYALLSPDWTNDDRLSPAGVDVDALRQALADLGAGNMPNPVSPPPPPPPPPPPAPPPPPILWPDWFVSGKIDGDTFTGTISTKAPAPPSGEQEVRCAYAVEEMETADAWVSALNTIPGVAAALIGRQIVIQNDGLTPEQWQRILAFILQLIQILGPIIGG